jgi:hypothetical protein
MSAVLPETAAVHWRPRVDAARLRRRGALWTLSTVAHVVPFLAAGVVLLIIQPLAVAVSLASFAHAWIIPELYAARGANVLKPRRSRSHSADTAAQRTALGLLGDLVGHEVRAGYEQTGLVAEHGALGTWVVGEAGAALLTRGGHRAHCFCVRVSEPGLPPADHAAHLLLALRADEAGFATVANLAFSGATWRVRRRLPAPMRPGFDAARSLARG